MLAGLRQAIGNHNAAFCSAPRLILLLDYVLREVVCSRKIRVQERGERVTVFTEEDGEIDMSS